MDLSRHVRHRHHSKAFEGWSSRFYDFQARRLLRRVYRRLAADIAAVAPTGAAVLDLGTGPGVLLMELGRARPDLHLTGIDLSEDMVTNASRNLRRAGTRGSVQVGDVADLPFPGDSFDLIVSSLSLHHWDRLEAAASQLARVLRPGGKVMIYDVPAAPFDLLTEAARDTGQFPGTPRRTRIRSGIPFLRLDKLAWG